MALKLSKQDQEFRNPLLFHGEAKTVNLSRVLLNLFMLLKYDGVLPRSRPGRREVTIDTLVSKLLKKEEEGVAEGFGEYSDQVKWWVTANLVDLVNRGVPGKEAVASLKAIHLNSYQYRNPKHARDYNISEQVYSMLQESTGDLVKELRSFLSEGWDQHTESLERNSEIDLDTLGILRIVEKESDSPQGDNQFRPPKCICVGQARIFADDVRRLLIYRRVVPRHVLLEYLQTLIGLHVGLYLFKLFRMLPDWVSTGQRHSTCQECPVNASLKVPFEECPYKSEFVVDCGNDPESNIARTAENDAVFFYARIHDYVRATFAINMALQFCQLTDHRRQEDIDTALAAIKDKGTRWEERFRLRTEDLINSLDDEHLPVFQPILDMGLPPFGTFIELVTQARASFHYNYHRQLLDSLFQRNRENGLIWGGRSRKHGRRFWLSSRMLETMVQLSVLASRGNNGEFVFYSEPILIESFLKWLYNRYGFIVGGFNHERFQSSDISVHQALKENVSHLKERLREIGFFSILSDAYVMQRIRPRYPINEAQGESHE